MRCAVFVRPILILLVNTRPRFGVVARARARARARKGESGRSVRVPSVSCRPLIIVSLCLGLLSVVTPGCGFGGGGVSPVRTAFNKGVYHYSHGDFDEAIAEYRLALEENEGDVYARFNLAVALEAKASRLRDAGEAGAAEELQRQAEKEYRSLLEERPEFLRAIVNLAACEYGRGLREQSIRRLEAAIEQFEDATLPRLALAAHQFKELRGETAPDSTSREKFASILNRVEDVLRRDPASLQGNMLYGDVHGVLGRQARLADGTSVLGLDATAHFDAARQAYGKALVREPSDIATLMALGRLEQAEKNWGAAASPFERVTFIDADHFEARLRLSEALTSLGDLKRATYNLWRARALDRPRNPRLSPEEYRRRLLMLYEQLEMRERSEERQP